MPISGRSSRGVQDVLAQILARDFLIEQQQAQAAAQEQERADRLSRDAENTRRFEVERGERTEDRATQARILAANLKRQEAKDETEAADRRQVGNQRGVRRMLGEFIGREGAPKTSDARAQIQGMALQEDVDLPAELTGPSAQEEDDRRVNLEKRLLGLRPQTPRPAPDQDWVIRDGKPTPIPKGSARPGDQPYDAVAARRPDDQGGPSPYSAERTLRTRQSVEELIGKPQPDGSRRGGLLSGWTTGMGSLLANVPGTDARRVQGKINTLKANIAFNELTQMREASKTGGALGQVAVRELELLESTLGSLDQALDRGDLAAELEKIDKSLERWSRVAAPLQPGTTVDVGRSALDELERRRRARGGG